MKVTMNYGKSGYSMDLPDDWNTTVVRKPVMPILPMPNASISASLSNAVGSPSLKELALGKRRACILVCDITRPVPNSLLLPAVIHELMDAGMDKAQITVLVATGLHRPNEGEELRDVIGDDWVLNTVEVVNHFAREDADHVWIGKASSGVDLKIDRRFVDADLRIAIGLVEPHFMAGYSGGRKLVVPGVAHADTIGQLHSYRLLDDPRSKNCVIDGNPLHQTQREAVWMLGGAYGVNIVLDENRNISFVNFGELVESHLAAVSFIRNYCEIPLGRKFKTVVTSAAGYPLDKTYYQTVKGIVGAIDALEPGGDLFILSECSEGLGSMEFQESQSHLVSRGVEGFLKDISHKPEASVDEWETHLLANAMRVGNIHLYSTGLSDEDQSLTGVQQITSLENEISMCIKRSGDRNLAVIPEGPYVIPFTTE